MKEMQAKNNEQLTITTQDNITINTININNASSNKTYQTPTSLLKISIYSFQCESDNFVCLFNVLHKIWLFPMNDANEVKSSPSQKYRK